MYDDILAKNDDEIRQANQVNKVNLNKLEKEIAKKEEELFK